MGYEKELHKKMANIAKELSQLGYKLLTEVIIHENENDKIIVSIIANKVLNDFDACIVLSEQGFVDQIFEIIRVMLDKIFIMRAIIIDPKNVTVFLQHQEHQREGMIKKAFNLNLITAEEKEEYLSGLSLRKYCSISNWARAANMVDTYEREYTLFSGYIHFSIKSLEESIVYENKKIRAIDMKPKENMLNAGLSTACHYALLTIESICQEFDIECSQYDELEKEWAKISKDFYRI